jgi:TPR repeat protein
MTNTSRLYFHFPDSGAPPVMLARSYCGWEGMPSLWRLLLADATPGAPLPISTAGNAATASIEVSALAAIDKLQFFADYIAGHPLLYRLPELPVFLDSALVFLRERLAQFPAREAGKILLVAQDAEGGLPDTGLMQDIEVDWLDIQIFAEENSYHGLDEVLGFAGSRHSFERWEAWPGLFGLDTLEHEYFSRLEYSLYWNKYLPPPDAMTYKQFVRSGVRARSHQMADQTEDPLPSAWSRLKGMVKSLVGAPQAPLPIDESEDEGEEEDDESEQPDDNPWLHEAFKPVTIDGKIGLRFDPEYGTDYHTELSGADDNCATLALAAEWDEIIPAYGHRAWARRDGLWGVIALRRHCTVLMAPCAERIVFGSRDARPYAVKDGRCGLIDPESGSWTLAPDYDDMVWCEESFKEAWHVRQGRHWGVATIEGVLMQPCVYDSLVIDNSDFQLRDHGWKALRDGRAGWITFAGQLDVACEWDDVKPFIPDRLYTASRGGRWGLIASDNQQWVPCDYLSVAPLALARHVRQSKPGAMWWFPSDFWDREHEVPAAVAECDPALSNLLVAVRTDSGMGVVDQAHRQLVPCRYRAIAPAQSGDYHDGRWLRVTAHDGRQGLWSVAAGAEIFACEHEWLDVFAGPRIDHPVVGTMNEARYQLWNIDGTAACDASFLWLSAEGWNHDNDISEGVDDYERGKIAKDWRRGKAVRAAQDLDGEVRLVFVLPGQGVMSEQEALEQDYLATGNREAALKLAKGYRDGFHQVQDLELARLWAARACGHVAPPPLANAKHYPPYCFTRPVALVDTEVEPANEVAHEDADEEGPAPAYDVNYVEPERDTDEPDEEDEDLYEEAAYELARMLNEGIGGPRDAPLALHWIHGAAYGTGRTGNTHAPTWLLLGKLLLDEDAGPVDVPQAFAVLSQIDAPSLNEGEACFYRAICLRRGLQGAPDLAGARELMVRADASGVAPAAPALAEMLAEMAATVSGKQARLLTREAAYYAQKAAAAQEQRAADRRC